MLKHSSNHKVQQTGDKSNTSDINKLTINLSDRNLSTNEMSLLKEVLISLQIDHNYHLPILYLQLESLY